MELESSSKRSRNQKQKNGKITMKLYDWHRELEVVETRDWRNLPPNVMSMILMKLGAVEIFKTAQKVCREWRNICKEVVETRDWLDLPPDVMSMILKKLGVVEILETAQKVCRAWRNICKDPFMWSCFDQYEICKQIGEYISKHKLNMDSYNYQSDVYEKIQRHVIDRSCGQMIGATLYGWTCRKLLSYIADGSPLLTCLRLDHSEYICFEMLIESISKLPPLTDIDLSYCIFFEDAIEGIGRCCPLLKSFKFNWRRVTVWESEDEDKWYLNQEEGTLHYDKDALAIATNMPGLRHLALLGNRLSNVGLQAILDGCSHLVSLDLRRCFYINMDSDLGKRCREQIKHLQSPCDEYSDESEEDRSSCDKDNDDHDIDILDDNDDDDDDDVYSQFSSYHDGYLHDEYDEIVNSRKFIESSLLLL